MTLGLMPLTALYCCQDVMYVFRLCKTSWSGHEAWRASSVAGPKLLEVLWPGSIGVQSLNAGISGLLLTHLALQEVSSLPGHLCLELLHLQSYAVAIGQPWG